MNIEKRLKNGNLYYLSSFINIILIVIYLINELFIFPIHYKGILSFLGTKPSYLISIKCCYAVLIFISLLRIKKEPQFYWVLLNFASVGVLLIFKYNFFHYGTFIDIFLLEICAIWLLIMTNLNSYIDKYEIKRTVKNLCLIILSPLIISFLIRFVYTYK